MAFKKGESGFPSGRPKGAVGKNTLLRQQIADAAPDIIQSLITAAIGGDSSSAKLLLDRCLPVLRPQAETFTLETIPTDSMADVGRLIIDSVLRAEIPADAGAQLLGAIAAQCKVVETTEILETLARLEGAK